MSAGAAPRHTNRLIHETSPYLLQHAHNPVDWFPWGDEALERAKREDKPILLSIGYAACHWCHVMERESFENEATAELMNRHFVCIKVDREERPDLDDIYMMATLAISGSGGWPMTVFLFSNQQPFFAGTYFPPRDLYGRPGFPSLLTRIAELWNENRDVLESQAGDLTDHLRKQCVLSEKQAIGEAWIAKAVTQLKIEFDPEYGGFGSAPKFPPSSALALLLAEQRKTHDRGTLSMVTTTLDAMKNGGIYDHVGGGFARYSTDAHWLVPHFEKMLYDNAQLARIYCHAYQVTKDEEYARVARETLDYVIMEMQSADGGYYSATDADSEGIEGKFFVFKPEEIYAVLDEDQARIFCAYYDIKASGNWEGVSILNTPRPLATVAQELGIDVSELRRLLNDAKAKVYAARKRRVPPLLDDKILTSWNALMIAAMAEGHRTFLDSRYLASATNAASFVASVLTRPDGGLFRTARSGQAHLDGYLEDYAFLSDALVDLYEASGQKKWLFQARQLAERMITDFADQENGGFFTTARQHEPLIVRFREGHDGAIPSANAVAARALLRLSFHFDHDAFRTIALAALEAYGKPVERMPRAFPTLLGVARLLTEQRVELVLVGTPGESSYEAFRRELGQSYLPNDVLALIDPNDPDDELPLSRGKTLHDGKAALYVCRNYACNAPLTDPTTLHLALSS